MVALVVTALPARAEEGWALWVAPVPTVVVAALSPLPNVAVSVGATRAFTRTLAVTWAFSALGGSSACGAVEDAFCRSYGQVAVSLGFSSSLGTGTALDGFFIAPKVMLSVWRDASIHHSGGSTEGLGGVDAGYQLRVGIFYAALVLGAVGGFSTSSPSSLAGPLWGSSRWGRLRPVWGLNVDILRLGVAF